MKLSIEDSFLYSLTEDANQVLETKRQEGLRGQFPDLVPGQPVRLPMAMVEAVLIVLHQRGLYTPPANPYEKL